VKLALVDSHAHLSDNAFAEDLAEVVARAQEHHVAAIINIGYNLSSSEQVVELACKHRDMFAAVGIHPHDARQVQSELLGIEGLLRESKVVAVGEIGLDYHWNTWPKEVQLEAFRVQIELAKANKLPFVVHDREAHADILRVLKEHAPFLNRFVMHCFSGSAEFAGECIRLGGYISLAGPVTFRNAVQPVTVAQRVPLERLLLETDCPYLAPQAWRGKRNEPAYVRAVAEQVALVRGESLETIASATTANAREVFGLGGVGL
jgi:TatD DNase family protein